VTQEGQPSGAASRPDKFVLRSVLPEWTPLYVGFLLFLIAIITYKIPVGQVGLILGVLALIFSREKLRFPPPMVALTVLLLLAALGQPGSINPPASSKELVAAGKTWVIALMAYNAIRTKKQFRFAILFACTLYAYVPVSPVLVNYALGITTAGRAEGPFIYINPNDLAAISLLALGITLWVINTEPMQKSLRLIGYGFAGAIAVMILLTQSRAGFLGLVVFGIPYALSSARRGVRPIALLVAAAVGAAVFVPSSAWERIAGIAKLTSEETIAEADPEGSAEQRLKMVKAAIQITSEHPLLGVGIGGIGQANYDVGLGGGPSKGRIIGPGRDTHNTYLKMSAEMGIPALIVFLIMLGLVYRPLTRVRRSLRESQPATAAGFGYIQNGFLAFMVAGVFGSYAWLSVYHVFLAIMWSGASLWLARTAVPAQHASPISPGRPQPVLIRQRVPVVPRRGH